MRLLSCCAFLFAVARAGPSQYVNVFIGTTNGGHVFPGATLPWGSVKVGADCQSDQNQAGYVADNSKVMGFSPLHDDGTGGQPSLGQFQLMPLWCANDIGNCQTGNRIRSVLRVPNSESAHPGFFSLSLESNIDAAMTVSHHAALYHFRWTNFTKDVADPTTRPKPVLLLDVTDLMSSFRNATQTIQFRAHQQVRVTGGGRYSPSFGVGAYEVHFCIDIPHVKSAAQYSHDNITVVHEETTSEFKLRMPNGALLEISEEHLASSNGALYARVGISWLSPEQACKYAEGEIPNIDEGQFNMTLAAAELKWDATLGTVQIDPGHVSTDRLTLFWSSLYRTYISPNNITGDNPLWESSEPYYDSMYCIWDSFRVVHPLYAITQRAVQAEFVRAIIDVYRNTGFLPDCRMSLCKGFSQGGSNADSLLSDSYVKGIRNGIDWDEGLLAMRKNAEIKPTTWNVEGRGNIASRREHGYIPHDDFDLGGMNTRSASRTLEYSFNDFSIALVAQGQGDGPTAAHFIDVSDDWRRLWHKTVNSEGYHGFLQPRYKNGTFLFFDPRKCSPQLSPNSCFLDYGGGPFYEASSWTYSFLVPHDMASVVELMGGPNKFVARLDTLFDAGFHDIGDEVGFIHCFLYNYAGRPDKTVDRVIAVLDTHFTTKTDGLPGNDDAGAMGGFVVFASFGLFPVAGTSVYLISTPLFKIITFPASEPGTTAKITTVNFDGARQNRYIQSAKLGGQYITRSWITHEEFFGRGGELELVLGPLPSDWGTGEENLPPSISTATSLATFS